MAKLKGKEPIDVDLNMHGQAVDGSSITLSSYIGTFAREHVPVTLESWKQLDDQKKDIMWSSLLNEIDELCISECPPNDNNLKEDSLTMVLGPERRGRVRGLGFRATSSQLNAQIHSEGWVKELKA
ncbi:hypothetical protein EZV62_014897 [Acer yangbiense]|uniref:Uncharacterized protein n=1 Tax=Acer yangbiense TaxID=1000413 RepID=A0A5C7HT86_9ROSI|nr:hypothetical protein EZV62_014896 [Acer yangbiense]TXG60324.1 hypothetical protein EZV62_014897 [Acer yangbiense]